MWVKVNEDTWVNLDHVALVYRYPGGNLILKVNGEKIPVDPPYSQEILREIEEIMRKRKEVR